MYNKRFHLFKGIQHLLEGVIFISLGFWIFNYEANWLVLLVFVILGTFFVWLASKSFKNMNTAPEETIDPILTAPKDVQLRYYKRVLILLPIVFGLLSLLTAYELSRLENGTTDHANLWLPLAVLYEHLGYWPTVLASIVLAWIFCLFIWRKREEAKTSPHQ